MFLRIEKTWFRLGSAGRGPAANTRHQESGLTGSGVGRRTRRFFNGLLTVAGLENPAGVPLPFTDGVSIGLAQIGDTVRRLLRAEFWCRLEAVGAFVHVGYDYYMYV